MADNYGRAALTAVEGIEGKITDVVGGVVDYIKNVNAPSKLRAKPYYKLLWMGDSIGAGTGATHNDNGFAGQLNQAMSYVQGKENYSAIPLYFLAATWTRTEEGIAKYLMSSTNSSAPFGLFGGQMWKVPQAPYKVQVVYSKRADGGDFNVVQGAETLATLSSQGVASEDGLLSAVYTVPGGVELKINPIADNKAYVNHVRVWRDSEASHFEFENWSIGGRKSSDYTREQIETMITYSEKDVLVWEYLANDYAQNKYEDFVDRTEFAIQTAKGAGMDVVIPVTCGNEATPTDPTFRTKWVKFLYDMASKYDCLLIDYDMYFGGFTAAKEGGLIVDTVHPSQLGHTAMANILVPTMLGIENPYNLGKTLAIGDTRHSYYNAQQNSAKQYFSSQVTFDSVYGKTTGSGGAVEYKQIAPVNVLPNNVVQLPRYAPLGAISIYNGLEGEANLPGDFYYNSVDWGADQKTGLAVWKRANAFSRLEPLTAKPSDSVKYLNRLYRLTVDGKDDQVVTFIRTGTGGFAWKALTLSEPEWT